MSVSWNYILWLVWLSSNQRVNAFSYRHLEAELDFDHWIYFKMIVDTKTFKYILIQLQNNQTLLDFHVNDHFKGGEENANLIKSDHIKESHLISHTIW